MKKLIVIKKVVKADLVWSSSVFSESSVVEVVLLWRGYLMILALKLRALI
jgi:hypothetical protein